MAKSQATIIPTMQYKDAKAAIEWLCTTLGFKKHLVVEGDNNKIEHAQLVLGNSMIMLGSERETEFSKLVKTPNDLDGFNTQTPYIIVAEIEDHYHHAKRAGAEIVLDLDEQGYGGKLYTCRDPEGYLWNFGSYDPWEEL
jgi:uncharacterized glyoxalase superfamily protein PhnB